LIRSICSFERLPAIAANLLYQHSLPYLQNLADVHGYLVAL
jgi:hypothetical protein